MVTNADLAEYLAEYLAEFLVEFREESRSISYKAEIYAESDSDDDLAMIDRNGYKRRPRGIPRGIPRGPPVNLNAVYSDVAYLSGFMASSD